VWNKILLFAGYQRAGQTGAIEKAHWIVINRQRGLYWAVFISLFLQKLSLEWINKEMFTNTIAYHCQVVRKMLHRPILIYRMPSLTVIDGLPVCEEERMKAEFYFSEQDVRLLLLFLFISSCNPVEFSDEQVNESSLAQSLM
jgi:hypothetical protein